MKGILYHNEGKWWVKYLVTGDVSSSGIPAIANFWCKAEVHPRSLHFIMSSTHNYYEREVMFDLHHVKGESTYEPPTFYAMLRQPDKPKRPEYRVIAPDGKFITVEEYMKTNDYLDRINPKDKEEEELQPVYVGTLTKSFGIKGYSRADVGHAVYELRDKYLITIFDPKNEPHVVSFYKESLEQHIQKQ